MAPSGHINNSNDDNNSNIIIILRGLLGSLTVS